VRLTGAEQFLLVREVVVDRQALDLRSPGDFGDRGVSGADLLMELHRRLDDAFAGAALALRTGLQLISALFT
jgi:hypothetical protein